MIRHVAVFAWHPDVTAEHRQQVLAEVATLPPLMHGLRDYRFGQDLGINEGNGDFAIVADFDDAAAYRGYRDHPAHQRLVRDVIRPIARQRLGVQFEI